MICSRRSPHGGPNPFRKIESRQRSQIVCILDRPCAFPVALGTQLVTAFEIAARRKSSNVQ